jgi:hypothetical protein
MNTKNLPIPATFDDFMRFLTYVDDYSDSTKCWNWKGNKHYTGYGRFSIHHVWFFAHRVAYDTLIGKIPDGLVLDHAVCQNRGCVNPFHLEPVSIGENIKRGFSSWKTRTHCKNGHEWNEENTYNYEKGGYRSCRACGREARARGYARARADAEK